MGAVADAGDGRPPPGPPQGRAANRCVERRGREPSTSEAHVGNEEERREIAAGRRAERVEPVQRAGLSSQARDIAHQGAGQQRERGAHQHGRREQESDDEDDTDQAQRYRGLREKPKERDVNEGEDLEEERERYRIGGDPELDETVRTQRVAPPTSPAPGRGGGEGEAEHERGEHAGDRGAGRAEDEGELAGPDDLGDQAAHAGQREQQEEKSSRPGVSYRRLRDGGHPPAAAFRARHGLGAAPCYEPVSPADSREVVLTGRTQSRRRRPRLWQATYMPPTIGRWSPDPRAPRGSIAPPARSRRLLTLVQPGCPPMSPSPPSYLRRCSPTP